MNHWTAEDFAARLAWDQRWELLCSLDNIAIYVFFGLILTLLAGGWLPEKGRKVGAIVWGIVLTLFILYIPLRVNFGWVGIPPQPSIITPKK